MKRALTALGSLGFLLALGLGPAPEAGAQTPPPTVPCDGCGPSGTKNPGATQAWAYPEHHCLPDGRSAFSLTFGLGKNAPAPVNFYARFPGQFDKPLGTVNPGQQRTVYPLAIVEPGQTIPIDVFAYGAGGVAVQFGDGTRMREFTLTCPCEQPPSTSSTPPVSPPPSSTPTTAPATPPGTTPGVVTSPPSSTPGNFTLPATGSTTAWVVLGAALLVFLGGCALLLNKKPAE